MQQKAITYIQNTLWEAWFSRENEDEMFNNHVVVMSLCPGTYIHMEIHTHTHTDAQAGTVYAQNGVISQQSRSHYFVSPDISAPRRAPILILHRASLFPSTFLPLMTVLSERIIAIPNPNWNYANVACLVRKTSLCFTQRPFKRESNSARRQPKWIGSLRSE